MAGVRVEVSAMSAMQCFFGAKTHITSESSPQPPSRQEHDIPSRSSMDYQDAPTVTVLLLGEPSCGKSTFLSYDTPPVPSSLSSYCHITH